MFITESNLMNLPISDQGAELNADDAMPMVDEQAIWHFCGWTLPIIERIERCRIATLVETEVYC